MTEFERLILARLDAIEKRLFSLEKMHSQKPLGPQPPTPEEIAANEAEIEKLVQSAEEKFTVDRSKKILTDGSPVPEDWSHTEIEPETGMQKGYIVLTKEERDKGFIRPLRRGYRHITCGNITTMALSIAETLARDPKFYTGGFCATCKTHFPNAEFVWPDDGTTVGT